MEQRTIDGQRRAAIAGKARKKAIFEAATQRGCKAPRAIEAEGDRQRRLERALEIGPLGLLADALCAVVALEGLAEARRAGLARADMIPRHVARAIVGRPLILPARFGAKVPRMEAPRLQTALALGRGRRASRHAFDTK